MNQSDFAKLHNVSRKTVTMWKSRGWLIMSGDDIDVAASNAQLKNTENPSTVPLKTTHCRQPKRTLPLRRRS
jgi:hypothetical protein